MRLPASSLSQEALACGCNRSGAARCGVRPSRSEATRAATWEELRSKNGCAEPAQSFGDGRTGGGGILAGHWPGLWVHPKRTRAARGGVRGPLASGDTDRKGNRERITPLRKGSKNRCVQ